MSDERLGPEEGDQLEAAIMADRNRSAEEKQRMPQVLARMRAAAQDPRPLPAGTGAPPTAARWRRRPHPDRPPGTPRQVVSATTPAVHGR